MTNSIDHSLKIIIPMGPFISRISEEQCVGLFEKYMKLEERKSSYDLVKLL